MRLRRLSSSREKKRYVVFRIHSDERLSYETVKDAVWNSVLNWLGEEDMAKANIRILKNLWDSRKHKGFIQCSPKFTDSVKVSLSLIHQIGDSKVSFQTLRVSGTIKSGRDKTAKK